jgi:hypothetical protein
MSFTRLDLEVLAREIGADGVHFIQDTRTVRFYFRLSSYRTRMSHEGTIEEVERQLPVDVAVEFRVVDLGD